MFRFVQYNKYNVRYVIVHINVRLRFPPGSSLASTV